MEFLATLESVATEFVDTGVHGLSVSAEAGLSAADLLDRYPRPHGFYRESTIAQIQAVGFDVLADDPEDAEAVPGHALIVFPGPLTLDAWTALDGVFSEVRPNPKEGG
jgi:hypothetical protein